MTQNQPDHGAIDIEPRSWRLRGSILSWRQGGRAASTENRNLKDEDTEPNEHRQAA